MCICAIWILICIHLCIISVGMYVCTTFLRMHVFIYNFVCFLYVSVLQSTRVKHTSNAHNKIHQRDVRNLGKFSGSGVYCNGWGWWRMIYVCISMHTRLNIFVIQFSFIGWFNVNIVSVHGWCFTLYLIILIVIFFIVVLFPSEAKLRNIFMVSSVQWLSPLTVKKRYIKEKTKSGHNKNSFWNYVFLCIWA